MQFEWDDEKERKNIAKHGISFGLAKRVFADPNRIEKYDEHIRLTRIDISPSER